MTDRLGHKQTSAMFVLMTTAREMSNPELEGVAGFRLDGVERRSLNDLGFVASRKVGNTFHHELTDSGWVWCAGEFKAEKPPQPPARSTFAAALYAILNGIDGFLQRENRSLADIFKPETDDLETRIRKAYNQLARAPRDWVGLVDLRPKLGDAPAAEVDKVLKELSRTGQAHLVPEDNRKALTDADHAAAIRIGGEDNHLLSIEAS